MKKILIITYHFPPEGGPAVQRVLKFVKYLPRYDYVPIILSARHPLKTIDTSLVHDIPSSTSIFQSKDWGAHIPYDIRKIMKRMFVPDNQTLWKYTAIKRGLEITSKEPIQLLFSSTPPHSVHIIAKEIANKTGIPWVADFRDEWTFDPNFKNSQYKDAHIKLEQDILQKCDAITTIHNQARENFAKNTKKDKIFVIRNGFDPDDFESIESGMEYNPEKLTITYTGRFTKKSSPEFFFRALDSICRKDDTIKHRIAINIVGKPGNKKWIKKYPILQEIAVFIPYQPHKRCVSLMNRSDVLLLIATNLKHSEVFPAKMYEYFYLRKPIFAVVSYSGELTSMLKEYGNAYIGYESDMKTIEASFRSLFSNWQHNTILRSISDDFVSQFNRNFLSQRLANLFDSITEAHSA